MMIASLTLLSRREGFHVTMIVQICPNIKCYGHQHLLAYVYPIHKLCRCIGEQKGPLSGEVPFVRHAVNSLSGMPGAVELAVAK